MKPAIPERLPLEWMKWDELIPALSRANRALARFDGILTHLRNPDLLKTPLTTREAVLSSKIEGTIVTVGEVLRFEAGDAPQQESKRLDIEEIVNYRMALRTAEKELRDRPFSLNLVLKLHKVLLTSVRGYDKAPGTFRRFQNHIGRPGSTIEQAEFVPPSPEHLKEALSNWEKYYHSDEKDALVQLAIVHAQFEFLHPFLDGNGRIGRILIPLFLYNKQILSSPTFYLSEYLEEHRDEYIAHLRDLGKTRESWVQWCLFFLEALTVQAERNVVKVKAVLDLYERLKMQMLEISNSKYSVPVLDAMFTQPIFQASSLLSKKGMPQRQVLMRLLALLVEQKMLTLLVEGRGRRPAVYSLQELVKLCDSKPTRRSKAPNSGITVARNSHA
jgi:Fic family protein